MNLHKIQQLVSTAAQSLENNEKVFLPSLITKLNKALASYPEDQTLGGIARVFNKMADNKVSFITKANLKDLYRRFYSRNTKFADLFSHELGQLEKLTTPTLAHRDDTVELKPYQPKDQFLANALNSALDSEISLKTYSQPLAEQSLKMVNSSLDGWQLKPTKMYVSHGNEKFLVIKADYETPKGLSSVFVPVVVDSNKIGQADIFMGNSGPQELNYSNLKKYLMSNAGAKLNISGENILKALTAASSEKREISGAEIALIKLNTSRQEKSDFFADQIVGQKLANKPLEDVKLSKSHEFDSFEKKFASPAGQAEWIFGTDKIKIARDVILRDLISFGHKNPQMAISKTDNANVFFSVALDGGKVGFLVPVKITNGQVIKPTVLLSNGSVQSFTQEGIQQLYLNNASDFKAAAVASPQFQLKASDLLNNLRKYLAEGNLVGAEDVLNVLA